MLKSELATLFTPSPSRVGHPSDPYTPDGAGSSRRGCENVGQCWDEHDATRRKWSVCAAPLGPRGHHHDERSHCRHPREPHGLSATARREVRGGGWGRRREVAARVALGGGGWRCGAKERVANCVREEMTLDTPIYYIVI